MAAKSAIDTAGNEGEDKSKIQVVVEWLKSNRLDKFIEYVQENNVLMEDFLTYDEEDIKLTLQYKYSCSL